MKPRRRHLGSSLALVAVLVALALVACTAPLPSTSTSPGPTVTPTVAPTAAPSAAASPSAPQPTLLDPDNLPTASLEGEGATAVCDAEQSDADPSAGESLVVCYDGLVLGLRALKTREINVDRLYLRRPVCASSPCTPEELATVTVTGWTGETALSVEIDWEHNRITPPQVDTDVNWPAPTTTEGPGIAKPQVKGAPTLVRDRESLPYCGNTEDAREAAMQCFRDAVLDGRPAEMLEPFDVSGGIQILRFDGQGLVTRYALYGDGWFQDGGNLIIGPSFGWSFHNWVERTPIQ